VNSLPPIPTPPALRWREFRIRVLPILFFVVAAGVAGFLWQRNITSPVLVGAVEVRNAQVSAPYAGKIEDLHVNRFQSVTKGTPVAVLVPSDPRAALDVIQSELNILQIKLGLPQTQQRNETDYEKLRVDWMRQRVDLASTRVNLELARNELGRDEQLYKQKLISDQTYDISLKTEQALDAEMLERSNLVDTTAIALKHLESQGAISPTNNPAQSLMAALQTEEQKVAQTAAGTEPVTLVAPMDGTVSAVDRQGGENLSAGDPIVTITAAKPEAIISYLRQPIPFEPKVGMQMEVRTRALQIQSGVARIQSVGAQFEGITNALAVMRPGVPVDLGLPIEISLPPEMKLRPGEIVDLTLRSEN
jgi:multidrug resistance efflux pump